MDDYWCQPGDASITNANTLKTGTLIPQHRRPSNHLFPSHEKGTFRRALPRFLHPTQRLVPYHENGATLPSERCPRSDSELSPTVPIIQLLLQQWLHALRNIALRDLSPPSSGCRSATEHRRFSHSFILHIVMLSHHAILFTTYRQPHSFRTSLSPRPPPPVRLHTS